MSLSKEDMDWVNSPEVARAAAQDEKEQDALYKAANDYLDNLDAIKSGQAMLDKIGGGQSPDVSETFKNLDAGVEGLKEDLLGAKRLINSIQGKSKDADKNAKDLKDLQEKFESDPNNTASEHYSRLVGLIAPYLIGTPEFSAAVKAIEFLPKLAQLPAKYLVKYAPSGALIGAATANPDETVTKGAEHGAELNLGLAGAGKGTGVAFDKFLKPHLKKTGDYLIPGKYLERLAKDTNRSSEEIEQLSKKGGQQLIGKALDLPKVNQLETNTLPNVSKGAEKKLGDIAKKLIQQGSDLFNGLTRPIKKNQVGKELNKQVSKPLARIEKNKRDLYDERDKLAEKLGFRMEPKEFKKSIKEAIKQFEKSKKEGGSTTFKKELKELKGMLKTLNQNTNEFGDKSMTLPGASSIRADLNTKIEEAKSNSKKAIWSIAKSGLSDDIEREISGSGLDDLNQAHQVADNYFSNVYKPFVDNKKLMKAVEGQDTDLITQTFLPKKDRPEVLKQLLEHVDSPEKASKLLLTDYFRPAQLEDLLGDEFINPTKMYGLINDLGDERILMLIKNPDDLKAIDEFKKNYRANHEALLRTYNPKTGAVNLPANILAKLFDEASASVKELAQGKVSGSGSRIVGGFAAANVTRALNDPEALSKIAKIKKELEALQKSIEATGTKPKMGINAARRATVAAS